jgi:uncharacterized protein with NRDE domain
MCTLVILRRPAHHWPLLIAANRDEMRERPCAPPGRHWPDRPEVVAGLDRLGGGSWLGVNDHGLVAAVMNRTGTLGPEPGKRSRGELVLEALDHAEAEQAARALADLNPAAYRPFNLVVADPRDSFWLSHRGDGRITLAEIPAGVHMLTAGELDDPTLPRIRVHLPRFRAAPVPDPETADWDPWKPLMASRTHPEPNGAETAMNLDLPTGFGTVSSAFLALPRYPGFERRPLWLFADGPPDRAPFRPVAL